MNIEGRAVHTLYIDEELRALIPALQSDELEALEASLLAEGCRDALVAWDDVLIDGHNRYALCHQHQIPFAVQSRTFASLPDAKLWMLRNQLGRRNLTDYQRGLIGLELKSILAEQTSPGARTDLHLSENSPRGSTRDTREEIAKIAGVSSNTISKIEKIEANAVPAIRAVANAGEISIHAASKLAALPEDAQREIAAGGKEAIVEAAKATRASNQPSKSEQKRLAVQRGEPRPEAEPSPAPAPDPAPYPAAETKPAAPGEVEALRAEVARLTEANAELAEQLAESVADNAQMGKIFDADEPLAAAVAENRRLHALVNGMQTRIDGLMEEKNEVIRSLKKTSAAFDAYKREHKRG